VADAQEVAYGAEGQRANPVVVALSWLPQPHHLPCTAFLGYLVIALQEGAGLVRLLTVGVAGCTDLSNRSWSLLPEVNT
jgi:hypothetical protein